MNEMIEAIAYYINEDGFVVLNEKYHLDNGNTCDNGCKHCLFDYENLPIPRRATLIA